MTTTKQRHWNWTLLLPALLLPAVGCCCGGGMGGGYTPIESEFIETATDANFKTLVLGAEKPVLVDFWASWCGPCAMVDPAVVAVAERYHDRLQAARLNIDESPKTAYRFDVTAIPMLALFHKGELVDTHVGVPEGSTGVEAATQEWVLARLNAIEALGSE